MAIECSKHEDWYPQQLQQQNDKLTADNAALVEALENVLSGFSSKADYEYVVNARRVLKQAKGDVC